MNRLNRRTFMGTLVSAMSAVVFTTSGWLMGTRSLTMPAPTPPPQTATNHEVEDCVEEGCMGCGTRCLPGVFRCEPPLNGAEFCDPGECIEVFYQWWACRGPSSCLCQLGFCQVDGYRGACGSCDSPCDNRMWLG